MGVGPNRFDDFDAATVDLLRSGMQLEMARRALTPVSAARNLTAWGRSWLPQPIGARRTPNRTGALRDTLTARVFGERKLTEVTRPGLATVLSATDLRTTNAVRFGSKVSSCSRYGRILENITVAEAVAASAAFPVLLPAIERSYTFTRTRHGATTHERHDLSLTDGGVYDNLGLTVLEPRRSPAHTDHVYDLDYIVSCDAGTGASRIGSGRIWPTRMKRSFDITYRKTQDASRSRLHEASRTGQLRGFVHTYLGMPDNRLPRPVAGLVPCTRVNAYRTNFKAMGTADLEALTGRGEQLTRALIAHYCPTCDGGQLRARETRLLVALRMSTSGMSASRDTVVAAARWVRR